MHDTAILVVHNIFKEFVNFLETKTLVFVIFKLSKYMCLIVLIFLKVSFAKISNPKQSEDSANMWTLQTTSSSHAELMFSNHIL